MADVLTHSIPAARFESIAPRTPKSRLEAWDAARLIATFGIVWTHVCDAQDLNTRIGTLGRFGTSYYILAAAVFTVRSHDRAATRNFFEDAAHKAKRLILPFAVWSAIYGLYYAAVSLTNGGSVETLTHWWGPFAGTALHLWFLPFIYVWGLWGTWMSPKLMRMQSGPLWLGAILGSASVYWICYRVIFFAVDRPWLWTWHLHRLDRWIDEAPFYVSAILFTAAFQQSGPKIKGFLAAHKTAVAFASGCTFILAQKIYSDQVHFIREQTGTDGRFLANLIGLSLLIGSAALSEQRIIRWLAPLGRYTYVAFLIHVLILDVVGSSMKELPGYGSVMIATLCSLGIFAISLACSFLISRVKFLRWLRP